MKLDLGSLEIELQAHLNNVRADDAHVTPPEVLADALQAVKELQRQKRGDLHFARSLSEALNSGDGVYRP